MRSDGGRSVRSNGGPGAIGDEGKPDAAVEFDAVSFAFDEHVILRDRQRVEQGELLKHHSDMTADAIELGLAHGVHALAVHMDGAAVGA